MTPGTTGSPGEWPWKNHSLAVTPLMPTIRFAAASYSTILSTNRKGQRCGIRASISRVVWTVSVTGSSRAIRGECGGSVRRHTSRSVQVCTATSRAPPGSRTRRRGQEGLAADAIEHVRRHPTGKERFVLEHRLVDGHVGDQALDDKLVEGHPRAGDRRRPVRPPDDELAEQGVVIGGYVVATEEMRIDADTGPARRVIPLDETRARPEVMRGILGVDPELDGMPAQDDVRLREAERLSSRDPDLHRHHVHAGQRLRHRVLDLDAAVDLDEVEVTGTVDEEFERAQILVARRDRGTNRTISQLAPGRIREGRRRRLLDDLLVPALDGAVALAEVDALAIAIDGNLDLDVAILVEPLLEV